MIELLIRVDWNQHACSLKCGFRRHDGNDWYSVYILLQQFITRLYTTTLHRHIKYMANDVHHSSLVQLVCQCHRDDGCIHRLNLKPFVDNICTSPLLAWWLTEVVSLPYCNPQNYSPNLPLRGVAAGDGADGSLRPGVIIGVLQHSRK